MSSVKINDKEQLERLAAQIFLQTGKKLTQQELLTLCVEFAHEKLEAFLKKVIKEQRIWSAEEIKELDEKFIDDFGEGTEELSNNVDKILYGD